MIRRFFSALFSFAVLATALALPSNASVFAAPPSGLEITRVGTDAMGADTFDNRNREFVRFKNDSAVAVDLTNVYTEDNWSHGNVFAHTCNKYKFSGVGLPDGPDGDDTPDGFTLQAGMFVTVYNGSRDAGNYYDSASTPPTYKMYANSDTDCGTFGHYFNNNNDRVWLMYDATGDGVPPANLSFRDWDWNGGYTVP